MWASGSCVRNRKVSDTGRSKERFLVPVARANGAGEDFGTEGHRWRGRISGVQLGKGRKSEVGAGTAEFQTQRRGLGAGPHGTSHQELPLALPMAPPSVILTYAGRVARRLFPSLPFSQIGGRHA